MTMIVELDASALSQAIHARQLSCREVMQAYLARIEALNPACGAIVSLQDPDDLLRQADARDAQLARGQSLGWMHGMPQAIKDMANTHFILTIYHKILNFAFCRNFGKILKALFYLYSAIAQLVERPAVNGLVVGSSPTRGAKSVK